jgi:hypothetical protein
MQRHTFAIISGVHQGATFDAGDALLVIGADATCDVCLSDSGIALRHVAIVSQAGRLSIRRLDGDVSIDAREIKAACVPIDAGMTITLGASGVRLQLVGEAPLVAAMPARPSSRFNKPRALAIGTLTIVVTAMVAALSVGTLGASQPPSSKILDVAAIQALLDKERLSGSLEVSTTAGRILVSGVIAADSEEKLHSVLAGLPISNTVVSDADLREQVREVFRTNGYDANVVYIGAGRVRIDNLDPAHESVRKAAVRARMDVAALREIEFVSAVGDPPADLPSYPTRFADPLSVHADGDTAYLSFGSNARYFVGSQLPDGARVQHITANAVLIDRNGQRSWFAF